MGVQWNESQVKILEFTSGNMVVCASAGSGKTTVMLERVLRLIQKGTPIERIVILAFNKSIASEIRSKLYKKISDRIEKIISDNSPSALAENKELREEVRFLSTQLDNINLANIVTNDSYCNRLVREFFSVLHIDPETGILGDKECEIMYSKCFNTVLDRLMSTDEADGGESQLWVYDILSKFGDRRGLLECMVSIRKCEGSVPDPQLWRKTINQEYGINGEERVVELEDSKAMQCLKAMVRNRCGYAVEQVEEALLKQSTQENKEKENKYNTLRETFVNIATQEKYNDVHTLVATLDDDDKISGNVADVIDWLQKNLAKDYATVCDIHQKTAEDVQHLMQIYTEIDQLFAKEKAAVGKYEYPDFMHKTLELLSDPEVAKRISSRYDYICVDEYQDTNYAQEQMFGQISNGKNLFMVGDSKQSIYGFRSSEPSIMLDKYNSYASDASKGETVHLDYNYRSSQEVVDFVNRIFNVVMTENIAGIDYRVSDQLKAGACYKEVPKYKEGEEPEKEDKNALYQEKAQRAPFCSINIFHSPKPSKKSSYIDDKEVYSVEEDNSAEGEGGTYKEGSFIAREIERMVGRMQIYDAKMGQTRTVEYRDIAILSRTTGAKCKKILRAIQDRQIPIDTAALTKADDLYEVDIIKQILRLISNDRDDIALAAVLCSYWIGMTSQELYDIRKAQPKCKFFFEACQNERKNQPKIDKLYNMLDEYRLKATYLTIYELAGELVYRYGYDKSLLPQADGAFKLFAVKAYLDGLQSLGSSVSLHEYVENIGSEQCESKGGASGNMVRAMTIHKSKGLEFPVVFLVDIAPTRGHNNTSKIQLDSEMGMAINYFDQNTRQSTDNLVTKIFKEKKQFDERAELMRLFYVALTRAQNHIFLTGTVETQDISKAMVPTSPYNANSFAKWIYNAAEVDPVIKGLIKVTDVPEQENEMQNYAFLRYKGGHMEDIDRYLNFEYPYEENKNIGIKYTVTEINSLDSYEDDIHKESVASEDNFVGNKAVRGTNYHAILEHIDYDRYSVEEVKAQLDEMVRDNILSAEQLDSVDPEEIARVLASPLIRLAAENEYYREREFMLCVKACEVLPTSVEDKVLVQGAVDLIIKAGDELYVVDFKKTKASEEVVKARYRKQLELYSMAVSSAMDMPVTHSLIYVIGRDQVIEF